MLRSSPPPYGPAERTAAIDRCAAKIDATLVVLERFHGFLLAARALPPSEVDGMKLLDLDNAALTSMWDLDCAIESADFDDLFEWATGKRSYFWCLRDEILTSPDLDRERTQLEIDSFREDYPGQVAELQALLDARMGAL